MDRLTAATLRSISGVDYDEKGYPETDPDTKLALEIDRAVVWLHFVTGRVEADITEPSDDAVMWGLATQLKTEMQVNHREVGYTDAIHSDAQEITVTGYSEKRISWKERVPKGQVTYHNELDELLWALMTDEKRAYWEDKLNSEISPVEIIDNFESSMDMAAYPWL